MQTSDVPVKFPIPFANGASGTYKRQVPTPSQVGIDDGAASLTTGFPPDTFIPTSGGGIPPDGRDFNGILFQATAWARWLAAGGPIYYDGTFATAIGGYPAGTMLQSSVTPGKFWISTANNNTTDPDGGSPANWLSGPTVSLSGGNAALGYHVAPDGFTRNWGLGTAGADGTFTVTFMRPFTTIMGANATNDVGVDPPVAWAGVGGLATTTMIVKQSTATGVAVSAGARARWEAWGYS